MRRFIIQVPDRVTEDQIHEALYNASDFDFYPFGVFEIKETWETANGTPRMTTAQRDKLWALCGSYNVPFREDDYWIDPSTSYVEGWIGGTALNHPVRKTIFVGVEPNGDSHS